MLVLHVEDEDDFASLTEGYLDRLLGDVTVERVPDAETGLERLDDTAYDCVISDYDMPGMDGLAFLETIREADSDLPVILFTGKGSEEVASEAISAGVTDYVQKGPPERFELLANRVEVAVREHAARRFVRATKHGPRELLERISDAFFAVDEDWRFTYVNRAAAAVFDESPEALIDRDLWACYPGATDTDLPEEYCQAVESGEPRSIEVYHEGSGSWHREHLYPADDGLAVISEDITEQKEAEERLWMLYEFHEAIIDSANVAITVFDPSGTVIIWNDAAEAITGYPEEDIVGTDTVWADLSPTDDARERNDELFESILAGETTVRDHEVEIETREGDRRVLSISARAIPNRTGEIVGTVGFARDVTERYGREQVLAQQARRLERFSVAFPDIAVIIDEDYRHADYLAGTGAEELFVVEPADFLDEPLHEILPEAVADAHVDAIDWVIETGEERTVQYRLDVPAGSRWFEGRIAPLPHDVDGKQAVILVARDVTERKERADALELERNRFRTLFEHLPTPVVHVIMRCGEPVIEHVNEAFAATFESSTGSLRGEPLDALTVPSDAAQEAASLNKRALDDGGFRTTVTRETVDGPREFVLTTVIDETANGDPEGFAMYTDVTDRE